MIRAMQVDGSERGAGTQSGAFLGQNQVKVIAKERRVRKDRGGWDGGRGRG